MMNLYLLAIIGVIVSVAAAANGDLIWSAVFMIVSALAAATEWADRR
jgi:hypothetical protein